MSKKMGLILEGLNEAKSGKGNDGKVDFSKLNVGSVLKVVKDVVWDDDAEEGDPEWYDDNKEDFKAVGILSGKKIVVKKGLTISFDSKSKQGIFDVCISDGKAKAYLELVEPDDLDGFVELVKY